MHPDIPALLILQDRDQKIISIKKDLSRIPLEKELAETRLFKNQQAVKEAKETLQQQELTVKSVELDRQTRKNTIAKLQTQQFETRKNEEFQAFAAEIKKYEGEIDELETRELESMEAADQYRSKLRAAEDALSKIQTGVAQEISVLDKRFTELSAQLTEIEADRATKASSIDEILLMTYDRLIKAKNGLAVASVNEKKQCGGCHVTTTPSAYVNTIAGKELVQCENCGTILYPG